MFAASCYWWKQRHWYVEMWSGIKDLITSMTITKMTMMKNIWKPNLIQMHDNITLKLYNMVTVVRSVFH